VEGGNARILKLLGRRLSLHGPSFFLLNLAHFWSNFTFFLYLELNPIDLLLMSSFVHKSLSSFEFLLT
jgi:hypothetical protein